VGRKTKAGFTLTKCLATATHTDRYEPMRRGYTATSTLSVNTA